MKRTKQNLLFKRKLTILTAAVFLGLCGSVVPGTAEAAKLIVSGGGRSVFDVNFVNVTDQNKEAAGVLFVDFLDDKSKNVIPYNHPAQTQQCVIHGVQYWADMLGSGTKNPVPAQIFIRGKAQQGNAYAASVAFKQGEPVSAHYWMQSLQQGKELNRIDDFTKLKMISSGQEKFIIYDGKKLNDAAYGIISIGQFMGADRKGCADGWWSQKGNILPDNEQAADLAATVRHEMAHALGFNVITASVEDKRGKEMEDADGVPIMQFPSDITQDNAWIYHLRDQNLNPATKGKMIITSREFSRRKTKDPSLREADFFILDSKSTTQPRSGKAYFVGDEVTNVLKGKQFDGVDGLPITGWETSSLDLSHLETGGLMSHADYRNYTVFTEVELAAMQDIGYQFDRKAYYGRSVYNDGLTLINTQGYSARNAAGTAYIAGKYSEVPYGIGLHVFGSRNTIIQAADILTKGDGAAGIRIDGTENTVTLDRGNVVHADGANGIGVLISYGRNQTLNQEGTVTADGTGGNGVQFDFGSNMLGAGSEYRGSYIRFSRNVDAEDGSITSSVNNRIDETVPELNGPLVTEYNLSGSLSGAKNAIYIGRNAFVRSINVKEGASISGNITSDWKHFKTDGSYDEVPWDKDGQALCLQYNGKNYSYDVYIPDLVTNLNFNANLTYNGNISGPDNMKLNVMGGRLTYGGKADVVGVQVAKGASLFGGIYTVHDMTESVVDDFAMEMDSTDTGYLVSHGTIGAIDDASSMHITGKLLSDGMLQGVAGGKAGTIRVSDEAEIDGSQVIAKNLLPDETFAVLQAGSVSGSVKNTENAPYKFGMLDEIGSVEGNKAVVTGKAANNLGAVDAVQNETYGAMMSMYNNLTENGDTRRNEMRPLFTLTPAETKKALSLIASNASANSMALAQRSVMTRHLLSSRLNEAFLPEPIKVKLPEASLDEGNGSGPEVSLSLLEPADNDIWLKFGKNWGDLKDDADYHSSTTLLGWDKAVAPNWRAGVYAGYSKTAFTDSTAGNELKDTRIGLYAGYNKAGREGLVFLNYGWMRNKLHRGVMGMTASADYHSRILELGGEYLYDLQVQKDVPWHVRPYVNVQLSRLWQNGYSETGAGVFNQVVDSKHNDYFGAGAGVEFKRYLSGGNYAIRVGIRHAFAGAEPRLRYSYMGNQANSYDMRNVQDKTHFVLSIGGETELAKGWSLGGDAGLTRGSHDKDWFCSLTIKRMW